MATRYVDGESVDAREQSHGVRTDVIEFTAGETTVVASEVAGTHASRGGAGARRDAHVETKGRDEIKKTCTD